METLIIFLIFAGTAVALLVVGLFLNVNRAKNCDFGFWAWFGGTSDGSDSTHHGSSHGHSGSSHHGGDFGSGGHHGGGFDGGGGFGSGGHH